MDNKLILLHGMRNNMCYITWSNENYYYEWMIMHTKPSNRYLVFPDGAPGPELYMGRTTSFAKIEWDIRNIDIVKYHLSY